MIENYFRTTERGDLEYVAAYMRHNDIEEVRALGFSPLDGLQRSANNAKLCYSLITPDGYPCAITGVGHSSVGPEWGAVWLLGTSDIEKFPQTFLRNSKAILDNMFEESGCTVLYNYCHGKNTLHQRWLRWLDFKFLRIVELPPSAEQFIEFVKLRKNNVY